ncbi:T9SS type A sorting domain-containing protein [Mariniflexile ostreae]|uniref:T9SS type A sorting domain-containing protein n=1 Tax=Mariniflexile ostreae TaxID=1520892 RepID=A0ABV5FDP1_9FLAO
MHLKLHLLIFLITGISYAQLSVKNEAYIFVDDQIVFVEDDIQLNDETSMIYLRNEAQLIQGESSTGNSGMGKLSVHQTGTVNQFAYNYWCAPVGNTDTNTAFIPNNNIYWHVGHTTAPSLDPITSEIAKYTTDFDGESSPLKISSRWLYKYSSGSNYGDWDYIGPSGAVDAGYGFTMKGTQGSGSKQLYDFRGKPNTGTIEVTVAAGQQTLVGNPYPSALDAHAFIHDLLNQTSLSVGVDSSGAPTLSGTLYFWEQDETTNSHILANYRGGYATYTIDKLGELETFVPATFNTYNGDGSLNTIGGSSASTKKVKRYIPVGQGFMIEGMDGILATEQVFFTNVQRAYEKESGGNSEFFRSSNVKNKSESQNALQNDNNNLQLIPEAYKRFRVNIDFNDVYTRQLVHNFHDTATDGFDYGLESKHTGVLSSDAHWVLNDVPYIAQAHKFNTDLKIPIVITLDTQKTIRFRAFDIQHFNEEYPIYLHDIEKDIYVDLKSQHYELPLGTARYNDRFEITFKKDVLSIDETMYNDLKVFQDNTIGQLTVFNPQHLDLKTFHLVDVTGKQIHSNHLEGGNKTYDFPTKQLSSGMYLVKITSASGIMFTQKIIITNK